MSKQLPKLEMGACVQSRSHTPVRAHMQLHVLLWYSRIVVYATQLTAPMCTLYKQNCGAVVYVTAQCEPSSCFRQPCVAAISGHC